MKYTINETANKVERPGREIKVENSLIGNDNVTVRIGTTDNKNCPQTVYILVTFWVDIKNKTRKIETLNFDNYISKMYSKEIKKIKSFYLQNTLTNNPLFPFYYDNIFVADYPDNINYNNKRSFTTIELTLHTSNCLTEVKATNPLPLKNKDNSVLFDELIKVAKVICDTPLLRGKCDFKIFKSKQ